MVFCLGNLVCMVFQRLLQAAGKAFLSMVILVSGAVTNIVLDPIMIFGLLGCPALGVKGAAIATVLGQWVSMFVGLYLCLLHNPDVKLKFSAKFIRREYIAGIYKVGLPTMITQAMTSFMVSAFNALLLPISSTAVAFFGVYYKLQNFLFMPMNGLGQAAIPIVGYNYGAKNRGRIMEASKMVYISSAVIALFGTLVFWFFGKQLLGFFSASEEMLSIGLPALRIISLSFVLAAVTMITGYVTSGLGDGMTNMISAFLRQFVPLLPCAYLLSQNGTGTIWWAFLISEAVAAVYAVYRMNRCIKKLKERM